VATAVAVVVVAVVVAAVVVVVETRGGSGASAFADGTITNWIPVALANPWSTPVVGAAHVAAAELVVTAVSFAWDALCVSSTILALASSPLTAVPVASMLASIVESFAPVLEAASKPWR
jgi:hypothetical protein